MSISAQLPLTPATYSAIVARVNGYLPTGTFVSPHAFTISKSLVDAVYYYTANMNYQTVYGGVSDAGSVDGTDCAAVLQACIDAKDGMIAFKGNDLADPNYEIATAIDLEEYQRIVGDATIKARLKWTGDLHGTMFNALNPAAWLSFENLYFDLNNKADTLLGKVTGANKLYFDMCHAQAPLGTVIEVDTADLLHFKDFSISMSASAPSTTVATKFTAVTASQFDSFAVIGAQVDTGVLLVGCAIDTFINLELSSPLYIDGCTALDFIGVDAETKTTSVRIFGTPSDGTINFRNLWSVMSAGTTNVTIDGAFTANFIGGNYLGTATTTFCDCTNGGKAVFYGGLTKAGTVSATSVNGTVKCHDVTNYKTRNAGYGTGNGSQQTIAHGCNFTPDPTEVLLSERSTGAALAYQSAAPDATNIYVTAINNKNYNWLVEKAAR